MSLLEFSEKFVNLVWGEWLVVLLFGAGLLFTLYFLFPQVRLFIHAINVTRGKYDRPEDAGEINHFQALCAALSATIGLGNIAGVAVAISLGGPGAVFWMWVAGFLGMATKFTSISLALLNREVNEDGSVSGGPMYTIKNALYKNNTLGMGPIFLFLAAMYAVFIILSSFGAGNMFQSNQMAAVIFKSFSEVEALKGLTTGTILGWPISNVLSGLVFVFFAGLVLVGGIKRIGNVAGKLVPVMVVLYVGGALGIVLANITELPGVFMSIITDAFTGTAATGGFVAVGFKEVVIQGARRAVFSNEAGMGSAAMAHSAAKSKPVKEGIVGLLGPFIDTIVVCTITASVMLITGKWANTDGLAGAALTASAFETVYGSFGGYLVTFVVIMFAFSTIISWSYYGEIGAVYLFSKMLGRENAIKYYRWIFLVFIFIGAVVKLEIVLNISDAVFGILAIPNLLANILLSKQLKAELSQYEKDLADGNV
jgi:alanine or glycine:cation symporter, AGCS family